MNPRPNIDLIKAELATAIVRLIEERKLTNLTVSELLGYTVTEIAQLHTGNVDGFSVDQMVSALNALNHRVDMNITPDTDVGLTANPEMRATAHASDALLSVIRYMEKINAEFPPEECEKLPTDLAANHDHYLYGAPKQE
jgi:predicted XRE-type DNA-binding protein